MSRREARTVHQASRAPIATAVGARYVVTCSGCDLRTPPVNQETADLTIEKHHWETED